MLCTDTLIFLFVHGNVSNVHIRRIKKGPCSAAGPFAAAYTSSPICSMILHRHLTEQRAYALPIVDAQHRLCKQRRYGNQMNLFTFPNKRIVYAVRRNQHFNRAVFNGLYPFFANQNVRSAGINMICALALESLRYRYQRSARDGKVVYNQAILTLFTWPITSNTLGLLPSCASARFIPNGDPAGPNSRHHPLAALAKPACGESTSQIVCDTQRFYIFTQHGLGIRDRSWLRLREKALHLRRMKIHRYQRDPAPACSMASAQDPRHELETRGWSLLSPFAYPKSGITARPSELALARFIASHPK